MGQGTQPSAKSPQEIMEEIRGYCKQRISLARMAESKAEKTAKLVQSKPAVEPDIDDNTKKLVMLTLSSPFLTISGYYDLLGFNYRDGNDAKVSAIKRKLLVQHDFHSGKRGGKIVLLEPTKEAFTMFNLPPEYLNPGFMHRYLGWQVKQAMTAKGYKVTFEKNVNGKSVDVVLEKSDESIAVELANTDKNEVENVTKNVFQAGFSKVVIIGRDKNVVSSVKSKLNATFDADVLSKVTCCLLSEFIDGDTP